MGELVSGSRVPLMRFVSRIRAMPVNKPQDHGVHHGPAIHAVAGFQRSRPVFALFFIRHHLQAGYQRPLLFLGVARVRQRKTPAPGGEGLHYRVIAMP